MSKERLERVCFRTCLNCLHGGEGKGCYKSGSYISISINKEANYSCPKWKPANKEVERNRIEWHKRRKTK